MMRPKNVPERAECLDLMTVFEAVKVPSKFCPGLSAIDRRFICPGCMTELQYPGVDKIATCVCGLSVVCTVAQVWVWQCEPAGAHS
jgi:hypothetical protein